MGNQTQVNAAETDGTAMQTARHERRCARRRAWYALNREEECARKRVWYSANLEKERARSRRRRCQLRELAIFLGAMNFMEAQDRKSVV